MPRGFRVLPLGIGLALLSADPALAQDAGGSAADPLPIWERTLYKTLTYQAAANLSDLALYDLVLGGTAVAGAGFFVANAASAAALYYTFEYTWQSLGPPPEDKTNQTVLEKTLLYRAFNSSRNFTLGYAFGGTVAAATGFVAANFLTDTVIFVTNEYAWDLFRPAVQAAPGNSGGQKP